MGTKHVYSSTMLSIISSYPICLQNINLTFNILIFLTMAPDYERNKLHLQRYTLNTSVVACFKNDIHQYILSSYKSTLKLIIEESIYF